jgi:hypothetical protein
MTIGTIYVPGIGPVGIRVRRMVDVIDGDGSKAVHVFLEPVLGGPGGGGEPLPLKEAC